MQKSRAITTDVCVRQGERGLDLQTGDRIFEVSDYSFNFLLRGALPLICLCDFVFFYLQVLIQNEYIDEALSLTASQRFCLSPVSLEQNFLFAK